MRHQEVEEAEIRGGILADEVRFIKDCLFHFSKPTSNRIHILF